MKKILIIAFFALFLIFSVPISSVYALEDEEQNLEEELEENVQEQIESIDLSGLENVLNDLDFDSQQIFKATSVWEKLNQILSGDFDQGFSFFFQAVLNCFFQDVLKLAPLLLIVVMLTILCSVLGNLKAKTSDESVGKIVNFVSFSAVVVIVSSVVVGLFVSAKDLISSMQTQMNLVFPILLTFLTAIGGVSSVGIFQPSVLVLSNVIVQVFSFAVLPLFVFLFVLNIVGNLSKSAKLDKLTSFVSSVLKWSSGICFGLFFSVLAIQGIVAGSFDGVSIKMARFAVKSYVPIIGGYLSDGFNVVMASSVLIKNAVGAVGIILLGATILSPIVLILACNLMLKFASAILEPIENTSTVSNFLHKTSKTLGLLTMMILGVAFAYFLTIALLLGAGNAL